MFAVYAVGFLVSLMVVPVMLGRHWKKATGFVSRTEAVIAAVGAVVLWPLALVGLIFWSLFRLGTK